MKYKVRRYLWQEQTVEAETKAEAIENFSDLNAATKVTDHTAVLIREAKPKPAPKALKATKAPPKAKKQARTQAKTKAPPKVKGKKKSTESTCKRSDCRFWDDCNHSQLAHCYRKAKEKSTSQVKRPNGRSQAKAMSQAKAILKQAKSPEAMAFAATGIPPQTEEQIMKGFKVIK